MYIFKKRIEWRRSYTKEESGIVKKQTIYVNCPHCNAFMEIVSSNGKIVRSHEPKEEPTDNQDTLTAELNRIKSGQTEREESFKKSKEDTAGLNNKLDALFQKEKKRVKETGDITPEIRPFDLD